MKRLIATFLLASCAFAHAAGYTTPTYNDVTIPSGLPDDTTSVKQAITNAQNAAASALPLSSIPTAPLLGGVSGTGLQSVTPDGTVQILNGQLGLPSANTSGAGNYGNITTDAQGRITAIHTPTPADITGFSTAAAQAAPVQSVAGNVGNVSSSQIASFPVTNLTTGSTYTASTSDVNLCVKLIAPIAFAITLPSSPIANQSLNISDCAGNAANYPITINGNGLTIMGQTTALINLNNESLTLKFVSGDWKIQ